MGFGVLFLGYLVTFVLTLVLNALGFGFLGYLLGVLLMLAGLYRISNYQRAFLCAMIPSVLMLIPTALRAIAELSNLFGYQTADRENLTAWLFFSFSILFQIGLLYAVGEIAKDTGLSKIRVRSYRNLIFVVFYAVCNLFARVLSETAAVYFRLPALILEVVMIFCNLFLILNCAKDICPAGEDEILPKDSKISFLNTLRDTMESTTERAYRKLREESKEALEKKRGKKK